MNDIAFIDARNLADKGYVTIFGLNIFAANNVSIRPHEDPRIVFLQSLCAPVNCVAHVGSLALDDTGREWIDEYDGHTVASNVEIHGGTFYQDASRQDCAYLVTDANAFLRPSQRDESLHYLLITDALVVYVGVTQEPSQFVQWLSPQPFESERHWVEMCLQKTDFVVTSRGDGWYFQVYVAPHGSIEPLQAALQHAVNGVRQNKWYQDNEAVLKWESELDCCLKIA
jgi:hypothetical protein